MFNHKYLKYGQLSGLNKYKYSAVDTSPLSQYVMHPTWNTLVKIIPKSIAPNSITFAGFLCMLLATVHLSIHDYDLYAAGGRPGPPYVSEIPNKVYILCGALIFLAYNLDGLDGKQARRLGVSGPLGELFDHGLDSYIVFLIPYTIMSIFGRDPEYSVSCFRGFLIVMSVVLNFYISHWEKYSTGTLYLPWGYDLSMWVCTILFIVEGVYGPGVYKVYLFGYTFAQAFEVLIHSVGLFTTLPVAIYNVYLSYKNRTGKMYSFKGMLRPLSAILMVTVAMIVWAVFSKNDVVEQHPRAFIFLYGTLFSNIASRLIIAEMCNSECELINTMFWPLLAAIVVSFNQPLLETAALFLLLAGVVYAHVHYGVCVVKQICGHLRISCFTVPKEKNK
ncbi:ethanolaminephosphotransferase 1-like [Anticarsia gemmatalis]|uniref:ethanolaminephosphotransferase 1-like n=1 Tax=Anticarsia gemmatalis TaxID=129554 RepID=UPI003F7588E1